jgi:hypothetical protein
MRAAVIRCFGQPRALDAFPSLGAAAGRVAADELWLVGPRSAGAELTQRATSYLAGADPDGLVVDHGEGWAVWRLSGETSRAAFARLADFPLPPGRGFVQGLVVQVPAKVLVQSGWLDLIVPVQLAHHIPVRVAEACADLGTTLEPEKDLAVERAGE